MKFTVKSGELSNINVDALVLSISEEGTFSQSLSEIDKLSDGYISAQQQKNNLPQKNGQVVIFFDVEGIKAKRVVVACCDQKVKSLQKVAKTIVQKTKSNRWSTVTLALVDKTTERTAQSYQMLVQQIFDSSYEFKEFKRQEDDAFELSEVQWSLFAQDNSSAMAKEALTKAQAWQEGTYLTRKLGNLPANICHPTYLADVAKSLAKKHESLSVEVLKTKDMQNLGMGALLGVAQGSSQPPRFIIMEYKPANAKNNQPVVLVGKGVTFDTGGISLKPGASMDEMKFDMCGAATVFGVMSAICHEQLDVHVIGLVAAVENMPDGNAIRPGDILTSMSGKTIEVLNTDAEGRLILCDALTYAERYQPQAVIDMATLTGACVVALGSHRAAVLGNDKSLVDALYEAGEQAHDPVWPLPLDDEYKDLLESPFADLPNISTNREAGTIVAAAFLSAFTDKYAWAHLDIAGVAWRKGKEKGGSGRPVGLLLTYLRQIADA